MNIRKTIRNAGAKLMLATTLAMPLFGGEARAEDTSLPVAVRAKAEYTGDFEKPGEFRQTLGLGMPGVYDGRTAVPGQLIENLRLISRETEFKDDYMVGARIFPQKLLKNESSYVPTKIYAFGSIDSEGLEKAIASETQFDIKETGTTFSVRQENRFGENSLDHFGGLITQKAGKFTPGFGFDRSTTPKGNMDQIFASLVFEPTANDWVSLVYSNQKYSDGKDAHKARFVLGHHGPKESWGHRSFLQYFSDNKENKSITAHSIVAPFGASTFGRVSNQLMSENTFFNDDFDKVVNTPYALYTETVPEYDRIIGANISEEGFSLKGLGFAGDYSLKRDSRGDSIMIAGKAVYIGRFNKTLGVDEFGLSIGALQERRYGVDTTSLTAGATFRFGKHFSVGGAVKAPLNSYSPGATIWGELKF